MARKISIVTKGNQTIVAGVTNTNKAVYIPDRCVSELLGRDTYTFTCNSGDGDGTVDKECLRMYRDVIIAMIGRD